MIKLFASDLDGTLLNLAHMMDPAIRSALKAVTASGAHFAVATGRTMRSTDDFGFRGVPIEAVCANGAIVLDRSGRAIKSYPIDPAFLKELVEAFPGACLECVGLDRTYVTGSFEDLMSGFVAKGGVASQVKMAALRIRRRQMRSDCVFGQGADDVVAHDICKVNARVADPGLEAELKAFLTEHECEATNAPFNPVMFEITAAGVDKGAALEWLAGYLGIEPSEVAVYGDGGNDVAMLERFEHAYATGNGADDAKRAAGNVIGSCAAYAVPRHMVATVRAQGAVGAYTRID